MRFREAGPGDVGAVVALVESAYRGEGSRAGWTTEADLLDGQRTDPELVAGLSGAGRVLLAVGDDDALLACCELHTGPGPAYFGMFAVPPGAQSRGTGSALLAEAERRAGAAGARRMVMTVLAGRTELIAWYGRRGFVPTGATEPFPYGDERFGIPLRDDLHFVTLAKQLGGGAPAGAARKAVRRWRSERRRSAT